MGFQFESTARFQTLMLNLDHVPRYCMYNLYRMLQSLLHWLMCFGLQDQHSTDEGG